MSEKEILEGNKLIAEFMGADKAYDPRDKNYCYHYSWDWIMPVIEKINSTHNKNTANGSIIIGRDLQYTIQHLLSGGYGFTEHKREKVFLTLENLWERVVLFIKWYNNHY